MYWVLGSLYVDLKRAGPGDDTVIACISSHLSLSALSLSSSRCASPHLSCLCWFAARGRRLDDNRVLHYGASHRAKFPHARPHTWRIEKRCCCHNPSTARFRTETGNFSVDKMVSIFLYVFQGDFSTGKLRPSLGGLTRFLTQLQLGGDDAYQLWWRIQ